MVTLIFIVAIVIVILFGFVLLFGAPYLPTLSRQVEDALEMIDLKPGQTLLELGCGDGRVMVAAAQTGLRVVGYELNPLLALIAWLRTRRFGGQVRVVWGNFWSHDWPEADGIYVFLLQRYMTRLDSKIAKEIQQPVKVVSFAFAFPGREPAAKKQGLMLYEFEPQTVRSLREKANQLP